MDLYTGMDILSSGLAAERVRMNVTASNLANLNTTRTDAGGPYQRLDPVLATTRLSPPFQDLLDSQVRGVPFNPQDDEYRNVEYYLSYVSNGLPISGPGARP